VEEICADADLEYKVDTNYRYYLNNWVVEMDWVCIPSSSIAIIASVYLAGIGVGGVLFAPLPEKLGRKRTLLLTGSLHLAGQFILLYFPNYTARLLAMAVLGSMYISKSVCFNLMYEMLEK